MQKILDLRKERTALINEAEAVIKKVEAEKRDITPEEIKAYDAIMAKIDANIAEEARYSKLYEVKSGLEPIKPEPHAKVAKNIGEAFVNSPQYLEMRKAGRWESDAFVFETRDILSSDAASGGALVVPQRVPGIIAEPERAFRIRDLLPKGTTTSNLVEFVREKTFTSAAAVVAESKEGTEVAKPESAIEFEKAEAPVVTIAHWVPVTRQIIADAPALADYINTRLIYGLKLEEEDELLNGDGTSGHIDGLLNQAQSLNVTLDPTDTAIDIIRKAILQARLAEYPVTGIVLNPSDWAKIELQKDEQGRYLWVTVPEGGVPRLWRVPVVETAAMPEGYFLVGAFSLGAQLWDREQVTVRVSEHHSDFFIKNLVAILCEERIALAVYRPNAFVTGTFVVGS